MRMHDKLAERNNNEEWIKPDVLSMSDPADSHRLESLLDSNENIVVSDNIDSIVEDLVDMRQADGSLDNLNISESQYTEYIKDQGIDYGKWVYFPWSEKVVRYPDKKDFRDLRTFRNQHLVRRNEQEILGESTVAVFGLSVGSNITDQLVQSGVGDSYIMGDFDRLSLTNLNRIRTTMAQIGLSKVDIAAKKMSEADPYIKQIHEHNGYTDNTEEILDKNIPDIIIEEVDDLQTKAKIRLYAQKNEIPLIMATDLGEKSILNVERHDLEEVPPFNGRISSATFESLLGDGMSESELLKANISIAGMKHVLSSPRLIESQLDMAHNKLGGIPQLGATAASGASLAYTASREIILGNKLKSGSYVESSRKTLKLSREESVRSHFNTLMRLKRSLRKK